MSHEPILALGCLVRFGVQELLLVVEESQYMINERDIAFVTPATTPEETRHGLDSVVHSCTYTWACMVEDVFKEVGDLKEALLEKKRKYDECKHQKTLLHYTSYLLL
jgi:hypothetical protein